MLEARVKKEVDAAFAIAEVKASQKALEAAVAQNAALLAAMKASQAAQDAALNDLRTLVLVSVYVSIWKIFL